LPSPVEQRLAALLNSGQQLSLSGGKIGLEKESLRMGPDGSIAQSPHPVALGAALTNPYITTDYSEALLEFITPPLPNPIEALAFLHDIEQFVYANLEEELLWSTSMPCVVSGESSIQIAQYGTSNAGMMKTVYRRGLGYRYGRVMQVIAGGHYNYSFPDAFWPVYQGLVKDSRPLKDFVSNAYFCLIRNLQRIGWLIPYLFGSSPAICKSFLEGQPLSLSEFDETTYYGPYATSLRMCDIGYQNSRETESGVKACYDNLDVYVRSLTKAIETPCPSYERIGVKVDGEYRQLNANILQIENEYYSSVRPKQVPGLYEKPTLALLRRGVRYLELRSLDINIYEPLGISIGQCRFLEVLMALYLFEDSPVIGEDERLEIDHNLDAVCYRGRMPGLELQRRGKSILLADWAAEICQAMQGFAQLLDENETGSPYQKAVAEQIEAVRNPEQTPSARILSDMRKHDEGFFHFSRRMSEQHRQYFLQLPPAPDKFREFRAAAEHSLQNQKLMEESDAVSFDEFLQNYFAQTA